MDIVHLINEYGIDNLRVFFFEEETKGYFRNPLAGWTEYCITECNPHHKVYFRAIRNIGQETIPGAHGRFETLIDNVFNTKSMYVHDFNHSSDTRRRVYVLVDEDDKYERIS